MGVQLDQNNTSSVAAYIAACPRHQLPLGSIPVLLVAGTSDIDVPFDLVEKFYMDAIEFKVGNVQV